MTSRERVISVIERRIPDCVPRTLYGEALGIYNQTTLDLFTQKTGKKPCEVFRMDMRGIPLDGHDFSEEDLARLRNLSTIAEVQDIFDSYPVDTSRSDIKKMRSSIDEIHAAGYPVMVFGKISDVETPFHLRGREQFFEDLGYQEEFLPVLLDRITDIAVHHARMSAETGADIFGIGDDLGSQRSLLISPTLWRELFKPRLKRIVDAVKNAHSNTVFFFHSDGKINEIIPDLIEIGIDILNPIQPEVMDPAEIKREFGKHLVFFGGVSVQHTLPLGTPEDVFNEICLRMETIGKDGGYIMSPSHLLNEDVSWENIVAFFDAADKYGGY